MESGSATIENTRIGETGEHVERGTLTVTQDAENIIVNLVAVPDAPGQFGLRADFNVTAVRVNDETISESVFGMYVDPENPCTLHLRGLPVDGTQLRIKCNTYEPGYASDDEFVLSETIFVVTR